MRKKICIHFFFEKGNSSRLWIVLINDANILDSAEIPGKAFDDALAKHGTVLRPTLYHKYRENHELDGHRYCIIEVPNIMEVPQKIKVTDENTKKDFIFSLWWPAKPRYCFRCGNLHSNGCPEMEEFKKAQEERNKQKVHTKFYTDSTMRSADMVGILADIIGMSGATLGEIGNAMRDDTKNGKGPERPEIMVIAGKNDIKKVEGTKDITKVAYAVDKGIGKIVKEINDKQTLNFVNIIPEPEEITPHQHIISDYIELSLNKTCDQHDNVTVTHIASKDIEKDITGHPTETGTVNILKGLSQTLNRRLILNEKLCTTERKYRGIDSIYKYGCQVCDRIGDFSEHKGFCDICEEEFRSHDVTALIDNLKVLFDKYFPPASPYVDPDTDMIDVENVSTKRAYAGSDGEQDKNKTLVDAKDVESVNENVANNNGTNQDNPHGSIDTSS